MIELHSDTNADCFASVRPFMEGGIGVGKI